MRSATLIVLHEVIQEFRHGSDPSYEQMVSGTGAGDVEQMALGVIDLLQIRIVTDRLDTLLQGDYFVIAGHYNHGAELQTFGEMHSAD